jgi:hypothetical protein
MAHTPVSGDPVRAESFDKSQLPEESFDAVLAEMRTACDWPRLGHTGVDFLTGLANRLQSAHEAEVAELRETATKMADELLSARMNRMTAVELLRDYRMAPKFSHDHAAIKRTVELGDEIDAFLSEQGGERENGDG